MTAELDLAGGVPKIVNKKTVYESKDKSCTLEAQDYYDDDNKMVFTCYEPQNRAEVMGIDLQSGQVSNFSKAPNSYNEPEGIFPDSPYTTVEADRQCDQLGGARGNGNIDIWKLRLDGSGKDFTRITHFNDYQGGKASNPVISTDGRFMAFQTARPGDAAGVGYGILLYWFKK
jgi:Tol biopolymer transport system component